MFNTILENFHIEKILTTLKNSIVYMVIVGVAAAIIAAVLGRSFTYRTYTADVSFYVYSNPDNVDDVGVNQTTAEISQANRLITSYVQVLRSSTFLSALADEVNMDGYTVERLHRSISTRTVNDTAMFIVYVSDPNPANALTIANAISDLAPVIIPSVVKAGGFRVFDAAELPTAPSASLSLTMIVALAFAVGVFLTIVFFVIKALLDTTIRRVYEVEDIFNIPIIGKVPSISGDKKDDNPYSNITLKEDSKFILNEAYNDIRANMLWSREEKKCSVFVVASADASEGRTINAYNIAKALSVADKKVLLIDADMRNSRLREIIPNKDKNGLADYLAGKIGKPVIVNKGDLLDIIYSSENMKNKSELLAADKWYELIDEMKEKYDEIVIDMPPLRVYADALSLARTDAYYLIVIREGMTKFVRTKLIVKKLESLNADIFGIIYNGISTKSKDYAFRNYKEEQQKA